MSGLSKLALQLRLSPPGIWDRVGVQKPPEPRPAPPVIEGVSKNAANIANKPANRPISKNEARKAYMREHMRKKRAAAKAGA